MPSNRNDEVVVTLIHGTWARRSAEWVKPTSSLCKTIREQVKSLVAIYPFKWSGNNSHNARIAATNDLVKHHYSVLKSKPNAKHYIIAHSHGGNVAMYALSDKRFKESISGIATLATPFINMRQFRHRSDADKTPLWGLLGLWWIISAAIPLLVYSLQMQLLGSPFEYTLTYLHNAWPPLLLHLVMVIILSWLMFYLLIFAIGLSYESLKHRIKDAPIPDFETKNLNLLIVRSPGDEANGVLGLLQTLSWLSRFIYAYLGFIAIFWKKVIPQDTGLILNIILAILAIYFFTMTISGVIIFSIYLHYLFGINFPVLGDQYHMFFSFIYAPLTQTDILNSYTWIKFIFWLHCLGSLAIIASMILVLVFTFFLAILLYVFRLPFGFHSISSEHGVLSTEITSEPCPIGSWRIVQLSNRKDIQNSGFWHSEAYSHPDAIQIIIDWLRNNK